jgi:hypothetical protein
MVRTCPREGWHDMTSVAEQGDDGLEPRPAEADI